MIIKKVSLPKTENCICYTTDRKKVVDLQDGLMHDISKEEITLHELLNQHFHYYQVHTNNAGVEDCKVNKFMVYEQKSSISRLTLKHLVAILDSDIYESAMIEYVHGKIVVDVKKK